MASSIRFAAPFVIAAGLAALMTAPQAAADPTDPHSAICEFGREFATYDYRDFDAHMQRLTDLSTGDMRAKLQSTWSTLRDVVVASEVHAEASNVSCAVDSVDGGHAEGSVTLDQAVTNNSRPGTTHVTMTVALDNVDGNWLVSASDMKS